MPFFGPRVKHWPAWCQMLFNSLCVHNAFTRNYKDNSYFKYLKSIKENTDNIEEEYKLIDLKARINITNRMLQDKTSKKYKAMND